MISRSFILTVPMTGTPAVPDIQVAGAAWAVEGDDEMYVINLGGMECVGFRKIGMDGAKTAFIGYGTSGIMSELSHLGTDAQLLAAYYADPTLKAKAIGWGVVENATTDGFLAPHTLGGADEYNSGKDYV